MEERHEQIGRPGVAGHSERARALVVHLRGRLGHGSRLVGFSQATAHDFGYCGHNFNQYINSSGDWQIIATGHVIASNGVHYLTHYHSSPSLPDHYRQSVCSY